MQKYSRSEKQEMRAGYLFVAPTLLIYFVFMVLPILVTLFLSFYSYDLLTPAKWIGLKNYMRLAIDARLLVVYKNTFIFTIFAVTFNVGIGLILAIIVNRKMNSMLRNTLRLFYFFPYIVAAVYVSVVWSAYLSKDTGIINYYLGLIGIRPLGWLTEPGLSMASIVIVDVWKNTGFAMVIFLAALQNVPPEYYEAAGIDGANTWQKFRYITFPSISPTVFFNIIVFSIGALQVFDTINILTNGGPGDSTRSVVLYLYEVTFKSYRLGYSSAISMTMFLIIMLLTYFNFTFSKRWVKY